MKEPFPRKSNPSEEVCVLALVKGEERFIWLFPPGVAGANQALRSVREMACDPAVDFSWYDAAMMMNKIKTEFKQDG